MQFSAAAPPDPVAEEYWRKQLTADCSWGLQQLRPLQNCRYQAAALQEMEIVNMSPEVFVGRSVVEGAKHRSCHAKRSIEALWTAAS